MAFGRAVDRIRATLPPLERSMSSEQARALLLSPPPGGPQVGTAPARAASEPPERKAPKTRAGPTKAEARRAIAFKIFDDAPSHIDRTNRNALAGLLDSRWPEKASAPGERTAWDLADAWAKEQASQISQESQPKP
jgi:hypothetical protein